MKKVATNGVRKVKKAKKPEANDWKPAEVDYSSLTIDDFEEFGGIEELTDYEVIKAGKKRKLPKEEPEKEQSRKPKKKRRKTDDVDKPATEQESSDEKPDMSAWLNCFVPEEILEALQNLGFHKPTEIQELSLPAAIKGHMDILAAAETGSGKTLAFGIPMITHIMTDKTRAKMGDKDIANSLRGLVLTPTRELAIQVKNHLQAISKSVDVKVVVIVGGMSQEKQRRLLKRGPDIIVATPGRLWQLMEEGETYLEQVPNIRYLVVDEADRMVEKGHYEELIKLLDMMNKDKETKRRQNFIFSATLTMVHDLPKRLEMKQKKNKSVNKNKLESLMTLIGVKDKPKIIDITKKDRLVETLTESRIMCSMEDKDMYLYYFVTMYPGRTLVFCNSINAVRRLKSVFEHLGCRPLTLHASMHQKQRLKNLETFASSDHGLLLASDVAARGLDITGIEHVVHFQVPRTAEIYVHRSGRTARAQNEGLSLMLIEPQEAVCYKNICKTLNKDQSLPVFPMDHAVLKIVKERVALARQIDQDEHRDQRLVAQNRWFEKAAEEMDVEMDERELLNELGGARERAAKSQKLKLMKKQLKIMVKRPIMTKVFSGSYPTKSGKLLLPTKLGAEKAINVMKGSTQDGSTLRKKKRKNNVHKK